jgi:phage host-nuclease inhibitor protein Gam
MKTIPPVRLEETNLVLKEIELLEGELEAVDSGANKQIADIKSAAAKEGEPKRKRVTELAGLLGAYAEYNRTELFNEDKKSVKLPFGIFGYRKSIKISVKKSTMGLLKKLGLGGYVRIKEEPHRQRGTARASRCGDMPAGIRERRSNAQGGGGFDGGRSPPEGGAFDEILCAGLGRDYGWHDRDLTAAVSDGGTALYRVLRIRRG